jgi:hypothetical protein
VLLFLVALAIGVVVMAVDRHLPEVPRPQLAEVAAVATV